MYKHWRGTVYPESLAARRWFEYYTTLFDTVEINNTFWRRPTEHAVKGWAAQAPPGFVYSLKLSSFGSHRMKLSDAGRGWGTTSTGSSALAPPPGRRWSSCRPGGGVTSPASMSS